MRVGPEYKYKFVNLLRELHPNIGSNQFIMKLLDFTWRNGLACYESYIYIYLFQVDGIWKLFNIIDLQQK